MRIAYRNKGRCAFWRAAAGAAIWVCGQAQSVSATVIYGGPTYDSTISIGYQNPVLPHIPGSTAGNGTAVGYVEKHTSNSVGPRAVRWDTTGAAATELGNLGTDGGGTTFCFAYAINTVGTTVGYAYQYTGAIYLGYRAVRWDAGGTAATALGNLGTDHGGYTYNSAYAINAAGTIVGYAEKYNAVGTDVGVRAVRWDAAGTAATELGNLGTDSSGKTTSYAYAINAAGTAVGYAYKYVLGTVAGIHAVRWDAAGTAATELSTAPSYAYAINTAGTTVGYAEKYGAANTDIGSRAARWNATGIAAELGNLGTDRFGNTNSSAYAINAAGTAAGYAAKYTAAGTDLGTRAVRWDAAGTAATELGNLGTDSSGFTSADAYAISAAGIAVGSVKKYTAGTYVGLRPVAWGLDNVAIDLNTLLSPSDLAHWTLTEADGISDTNWITGVGSYDPDGTGSLPAYQRAFLIQLPEPSLATVGIAGCALLSRRQRRRRRAS